MEFYLMLASASAAIAALTVLLFLKTRHVGFPVGIGLLYYWSLYGAWSIITDMTGGDSGKHYDYLTAKMFPVDLDDTYIWALFFYAIFIGIVAFTVLWLMKPTTESRPSDGSAHPTRISHGSFLILSVAAIVMSFFIMQDQLQAAIDLDMSAYYATRGGLGEYHKWFVVHQILNRIAVFALAIGFAVYLAANAGRYFIGETRRSFGLGYAIMIAGTFGFLAMMGNKNELFSALLLGTLFYVSNAKRVNWNVGVPIGLIAFLGIASIDLLRGFSILALLSPASWWEALTWAPEIRSSNEAFAPHFSLYGVLHFHAMLTYGSSFIALASSIVPRFLWPERPEGTYVQYAESLGIYEGPSGQGFAVHHATGWYLNFGLWGLIAGALLLGAVWALCFNAHVRAKPGDRRWRNVLAIVAPAGFVSFIPPLIRAGPEAYKGMIIEAFLIPTAIIVLASLRWKTVWQFVCGERGAQD